MASPSRLNPNLYCWPSWVEEDWVEEDVCGTTETTGFSTGTNGVVFIAVVISVHFILMPVAIMNN